MKPRPGMRHRMSSVFHTSKTMTEKMEFLLFPSLGKGFTNLCSDFLQRLLLHMLFSVEGFAVIVSSLIQTLLFVVVSVYSSSRESLRIIDEFSILLIQTGNETNENLSR